MKFSHLLFFMFLLGQLYCFGQKRTQKLLQGNWRHDLDSLAIVKIKGNVWTFTHTSDIKTKTNTSDSYKISIIDICFDNKTKSKFLKLSNQADTLEFEILNLNDTILSLMYLTRGNFHLYHRIKK